jgi:hypothetical protein
MNADRNVTRLAAAGTAALAVTALLIILVGCSKYEPAPAASQPAEPAAATPPQTPAPAAAPKASEPAPKAPAAAPEAPKAKAGEKKAAVGVGAKGRGYGPGIIATPVKTLFAVRERMVFEVQIPEAMKLFKATNDRAPKDNAEFMEKIIKENNIHLPELPAGDRYMYDPKTEQLMVESPKPE